MTTVRTLGLVFLIAAAAAGWDAEKVRVGDPAPDFASPKLGGGPLRLSDLRGKNVVLVFYRGHW